MHAAASPPSIALVPVKLHPSMSSASALWATNLVLRESVCALGSGEVECVWDPGPGKGASICAFTRSTGTTARCWLDEGLVPAAAGATSSCGWPSMVAGPWSCHEREGKRKATIRRNGR